MDSDADDLKTLTASQTTSKRPPSSSALEAEDIRARAVGGIHRRGFRDRGARRSLGHRRRSGFRAGQEGARRIATPRSRSRLVAGRRRTAGGRRRVWIGRGWNRTQADTDVAWRRRAIRRGRSAGGLPPIHAARRIAIACLAALLIACPKPSRSADAFDYSVVDPELRHRAARYVVERVVSVDAGRLRRGGCSLAGARPSSSMSRQSTADSRRARSCCGSRPIRGSTTSRSAGTTYTFSRSRRCTWSPTAS